MRGTAEDKRKREKEVVELMISVYCRKNHAEAFKDGGLCAECSSLREYARSRSDRCPFMETKTFCSNCRVHCYSPDMRQQIKKVMRFSGPRRIIYHPVMAVRHLIESKREKKRLEREDEC